MNTQNRTYPVTCCLAFLACLAIPPSTFGQTDVPAPIDYSHLDLSGDGYIDMHDVNLFHTRVAEHGHLGRGSSLPLNPAIAALDFDADEVISLWDGMEILQNFGHLDENGVLIRSTPNGCQLGDFNADAYVDDDDKIEFDKGLLYWLWWNSGHPFKPSIYTFGDVDMNGVIDSIDYEYLRLLWTAGVKDFDERYGAYMEPQIPAKEPCQPRGYFLWLLMM